MACGRIVSWIVCNTRNAPLTLWLLRLTLSHVDVARETRVAQVVEIVILQPVWISLEILLWSVNIGLR